MADAVLDLIVKLKDEASGGIGKIGDAVSGLGAPLAAIGAAGVAGITAIAVAAGAAIGKTLEWSEKLDGLGDVLGTTGEESAALTVAIQGVGGDVDKITGQMSFFQKGLTGAKGALGPTGEAAKQLGIDVKSAGFKSLTASEQLATLATKVNAMPDGLEKSKLMMQLFGKSGKDMSDVMGALADGGLEAARAKAKEFGLVLDEDAITANLAFNRSMNDMKMMLDGVVVSIGQELMPIIIPMVQSFMAFAREHLPAVREAMKGVVTWLGNLFKSMVDTNGIITILGNAFNIVVGAITAVADAFEIANEFTSGFGERLGATLDLLFGFGADGPGIFQQVGVAIDEFITSAKAGFETVVAWVTTNWPMIRDTVLGVVNAIVAWVQANWPAFRDSFINTFNEIVAWVQSVWPTIETAIRNVLETVKTIVSTALAAVMEFWRTHGAEIKAFAKSTWDSIQEIISLAWEVIKTAVDLATTAIGAILTAFFGDAEGDTTTTMDKIQTIFQVAWDAIKLVINTVLELIKGILKAALALMKGDTTEALDIIKNTFSTIWEGIKTTLGPVVESIKKAVSDMMDAIQKKVESILKDVKQFFIDTFNAVVKAINDAIETAKTAAGNLASGILSAISGKMKEAEEAILGPIRKGVGDVESLISGLWSSAKKLSDFVGSIRLPSFPSAPSGGGTVNTPVGPVPGRSGGNSFSGSGGAPVIINIYSRGAGYADVVAAVNDALRQAGYRSDARIRTA